MKTYFIRIITKSSLRNLYKFHGDNSFMEAVNFANASRTAENVITTELLSIGGEVVNRWSLIEAIEPIGPMSEFKGDKTGSTEERTADAVDSKDACDDMRQFTTDRLAFNVGLDKLIVHHDRHERESAEAKAE